jgi:quercetin dioxygenase-like cupin family protein
MNDQEYCFCELAPLYALGILDESERCFVEDQITNYPELAAELDMFQTSVAAMFYHLPPISLAVDLKKRLFQRIGVDLTEESPDHLPVRTNIVSNLVVRSHNLTWRPYRTPGVMVAVLHINPIQQKVTALVKAESGVRYPTHRHAGVEEIFMLAGDLVIGEEVYGQGDYIRSPQGSVHTPETQGGCMFFVSTSLNDHYPGWWSGWWKSFFRRGR